ncbi:MAG: nucleotidyltransferase family protein [Coriobacteriia bacterium]|nr:nucleotidyltransferase family protein [Coriobacteriia bacterium]
MTQAIKQAQPRQGCVIMASGLGRRFGGNKLMAELEGIPLVQHAIQATEGLFDQRVLVTRQAEVAQLCQAWSLPVVLHDKPKRNDTVRLGMTALEGCLGTATLEGCDTITFVQGDQPLISARTIALLLRQAEQEPDAIWRVRSEGTPGTPVTFPAWTFNELRSLPSGAGGGFIIKAHPEQVRYVEAESPWELFDVDTQNDLAILKEHLRARGDASRRMPR